MPATTLNPATRKSVSIYEQDCHGRTHYRVMTTHGGLIFGRHMTDFPSLDEAIRAVRADFRRNGFCGILEIHSMNGDGTTNRQPTSQIVVPEWKPE